MDYNDEQDYIIEEETTDSNQKKSNWDAAIGLNEVDGLTPSETLIYLSNKNIKGEIKYEDVESSLKSYYETQDPDDIEVQKKKECDLVSLRITQLLDDKSFGFNPITLKNIHRYLFKDIYDFAGNYRITNITKKEPILNGDTISYVDKNALDEYLAYDFNEEKNFDYEKINNQQFINHLSKFVSDIWQIHPFREGNTRTTAVFIEKYLNTMGFNVNNDMFKEHSVYFRNALVRSNYRNIPKRVPPTFEYLNKFFENLLLGKKHILDNKELYVKELFEEEKNIDDEER